VIKSAVRKKTACFEMFQSPVSPTSLFDEAPISGAFFILGDPESSHLTLEK